MALERSQKNTSKTSTAVIQLMSQKKAYEQTITGKLEALSLPDAADTIWARIEFQLDIDMPTGDGGDNGLASPSGGSWIGRGGLFIFVLGFVTIFLVSNNNKKQSITKTNPVETKTSPGTNNLNATNNERHNLTRLPIQPKRTSSSVKAAINKVDDTPSAIPITIEPAAGDILPQDAVIKPPPLLVVDSAQQKRKKKGVSGITDNDYRIVPVTKDSIE